MFCRSVSGIQSYPGHSVEAGIELPSVIYFASPFVGASVSSDRRSSGSTSPRICPLVSPLPRPQLPIRLNLSLQPLRRDPRACSATAHRSRVERRRSRVHSCVVVTRWERVRKQNHWLDAPYNASVAGSLAGVRLIAEPQPSAPQTQRREVPTLRPAGRPWIDTDAVKEMMGRYLR